VLEKEKEMKVVNVGDKVRHKISGDVGIVESVGMTDCALVRFNGQGDSYRVLKTQLERVATTMR
jgi:hypothetical protein